LHWLQPESNRRSLPTVSGRQSTQQRSVESVDHGSRRILPVVADELLGGSDPFDDPFGDLEKKPVRSQGINEPLRTDEPRPPAVQPGNLPAPIQLPSAPVEEESFPLEEIAPQDKGTGSLRTDCDKLDCFRLRHELEQTSIREISLNITPKFNSNSNVPPQHRETELRVWKDSKGRDLLTGALVDYRFNRVTIKRADGTVVEFATDDLSEKDICYIAITWGIPLECPLDLNIRHSRDWTPLTMTWKASALCHKPLYFEEVQLERYGHTTGPFSQPLFSGGHFILNIATLPYKMGMHPMNECQYSLGYYRPGSCAPRLLSPIPLSLRGGLAEAGVIFGGGTLFP